MRHRSLAEQHPILLGLGILFGIAFVITYWPVFVAAGVAYGGFVAARAAGQTPPSTPVRARRDRRPRLRARRDHARRHMARHIRAVSTCSVGH
jgi:hypothetical protein